MGCPRKKQNYHCLLRGQPVVFPGGFFVHNLEIQSFVSV